MAPFGKHIGQKGNGQYENGSGNTDDEIPCNGRWCDGEDVDVHAKDALLSIRPC